MRVLKSHFPKNESGIALIIVLIMVIVLSILAFGFAYSMKVETTLARHASFSSELDWMGRSGVEVAKWALAQSMTGPNAQFDSRKQRWAGGPGETNDALAEVDLKNYPLGNGTLSIEIQDLDRKFNINTANEVILRQALTLITADAADSATVVNSILDWRDRDSDPHPGGTESAQYETEDPPYFAKDGAIDDLTELLLVRGVTPNMYWGSGGGGSSQQVFNRAVQGRKSVFDEPTYRIGLVDLFTPISSGRINILTTTADVMQLIPAIDATFAEAIIKTRGGIDEQTGTEDDPPFRSAGELLSRARPGVDPGILGSFGTVFDVHSRVFEAHVTASVGASKREYVAVLRRNGPKDIQTLNLYWK